ncbi:MAG: MFS transporter [Deferribacteraceae bacterium]|nr:MFS transporter [Deferribacteraceae bacterium]
MLRRWIPVGCLSLAAFVFVISELLPVGLLPEISAGIGESESRTGLLMTGYAWIVALVSLPLTLLTARLNRKPLLIAILLLFSIGGFLGSFASSFMGVFLPRVLIAFAHGVFWSVSTPLAVRLSPGGKHGTGLGMISAGVALATILGVPIATYLGHIFTWTAAFKFISAISITLALLFAFALPSLPSQNTGSLKSIPELARNKGIRTVYYVTVLVVTGHFASYTFLTPYLREAIGASSSQIVTMLAVYGASGVLGIFLAGKYMDRYLKKVLVTAACGMLSAFVLFAICRSYTLAIPVLALWSISMSAMGLAMQSWLLRLATKAADAAVSIHSSLFNVGIGSGALIGGLVLDNAGLTFINPTSAILMIPVGLILLHARMEK